MSSNSSVNEYGVKRVARMDYGDYEAKLLARGHDALDREVPDPVPMAPPIGYKKQPSMVDHVRAMVRSEQLRLHAELQGLESFEDADDFEVADDLEPASPYDMSDLEPVSVLRQKLKDAEAAAKAAKDANASEPSPPPPPAPEASGSSGASS